MAALFPASSRMILGDGSVATHSPTYTAPENPDWSSESDSEIILSLFGEPEPNFGPPELDRGGRPFPYTRSKTRWRKRPNDELKYLRSQISALEGVLATLSHSDGRAKLLGNGRDAGDDNQAEVLQRLGHESRARKMQAALAENRKLRAMVSSHFQVAKSLQVALDENMRLRARKVFWPSSNAASDELVFALLDEEKELQYAATDKVLDESGVARIYHPYFSEPVLQRDAKSIYFEHIDVRVLPFPVADVACAVRHSLRHGSRVGPTQHCRKYLMHGSFSQAVTVDNVEVPGSLPAEVKGRHLLWSVENADRTIINWSSFNEYTGSRHVRLLKRIWFSVEPIQFDKTSPALPGRTQGAVLRTIVRFRPVDTDLNPKEIEEMADIVIEGYKRDSVRVVMAVRAQLAPLNAARK